jgi:hypothetical protein
LAIMSQSFFLNSSLSSTLSASSFAVSGSTCRFVAVWEKVGTLGFNNLGLFMGNYMAHTLNIWDGLDHEGKRIRMTISKEVWVYYLKR